MAITSNFKEHFEELIDPRLDNHNKRHNMDDILIITLLAVVSGCDSWVDIELYGNTKEAWLKSFLELPNGIPSHDTLGRFFQLLDPVQFQLCFINWIKSLVKMTDGEVVAIDGKTVRHSYDKGSSKKAIHMVSAWASQNRMVLGQLKCEEKSNEITAMPKLLKLLDITDCVVTADAMGCQRELATLITEKGGDYVFTVKGNQGKLQASIKEAFEKSGALGYANMVYYQDETLDAGHGRIENRSYTVLPLMYLYEHKVNWKGLKSFVMANRTRMIGDRESTETSYFISSLEPDAKLIGNAIRQHWSIENELHWCLDIAFREDECRIRKDNAAENFVVIRHIALNALKAEKTTKAGIAAKRKRAGWDNDYLLRVLDGLGI